MPLTVSRRSDPSHQNSLFLSTTSHLFLWYPVLQKAYVYTHISKNDTCLKANWPGHEILLADCHCSVIKDRLTNRETDYPLVTPSRAFHDITAHIFLITLRNT